MYWCVCVISFAQCNYFEIYHVVVCINSARLQQSLCFILDHFQCSSSLIFSSAMSNLSLIPSSNFSSHTLQFLSLVQFNLFNIFYVSAKLFVLDCVHSELVSVDKFFFSLWFIFSSFFVYLVIFLFDARHCNYLVGCWIFCILTNMLRFVLGSIKLLINCLILPHLILKIC